MPMPGGRSNRPYSHAPQALMTASRSLTPTLPSPQRGAMVRRAVGQVAAWADALAIAHSPFPLPIPQCPHALLPFPYGPHVRLTAPGLHVTMI